MTEPSQEELPPLKPYAAWAFLWIGGGMTVGALLMWLSDGYQWLRYGGSASYPLTSLFVDMGLGYPSVSWVGLQRIIDWLMACPASVILFFVGLLLCLWAGSHTEEHDKQTRDYQHRKRMKEIEAEREARNAEREAQTRRQEENRARREAERQLRAAEKPE